MDKSKQFLGVDISKDVFDVYYSQGNYHQFKNNHLGYKKLLKLTTESTHCIMEATGYYHLRLAYFLLENNITVSVENIVKEEHQESITSL